MRFLKNTYVKILTLSLVFGALGMFFIGDKLWAIPAMSRERQPVSVRTQNVRTADQVSVARPKTSVVNPVKTVAVQKKSLSGREALAKQRVDALSKERKLQDVRDDIDSRPLNDIVDSKESDRYTQSEAHMHLGFIRQLINKNYNVAPYLNVISTALVNESKFKNTHYVFYHTTSNMWRLTQDLYTQLFAYENPGVVDSKFKFLRYNDESVNATAQGWLAKELREKGLVDDNADAGAILLSANLSLFGNVGFPGECSWRYFVDPVEHKKPKRETYEAMMQKFGMTDKYIDEIMSLVDIYDTKEDTIVQILVPKNLVGKIGYLAWVKGIPAHEETIDLIKSTAKGQAFEKVKPVMEQLTERFAKEKINNPLYKDMMASVKQGDFSLESYLKVYRNKPWELDNINDVTARLLFTPDVLLNPSSGVKFYRFSAAHRDQLKEYRIRLNELVDKLIADKEAREESVTNM